MGLFKSISILATSLGIPLVVMFNFLLGEVDKLLVTLFVIMIINIVMVLIKSFSYLLIDYKRVININVKNIIGKSGIIVVVIIANLCGDLFVSGGEMVKYAVIIFFIATESAKILEVVRWLGVEYPKVLDDLLERIKTAQTDKLGLLFKELEQKQVKERINKELTNNNTKDIKDNKEKRFEKEVENNEES